MYHSTESFKAVEHPLEMLARSIETCGVPYDQACPTECAMAHAGRLGLVPRRRHSNHRCGPNCGCPECLNYLEAKLDGMSSREMEALYFNRILPASTTKKRAAEWLRNRARELTAAKGDYATFEVLDNAMAYVRGCS